MDLRLGMINFSNGLVPDYELDLPGCTKRYDIPSVLNKSLYQGELDISPVSSMEYLHHSESYQILPGMCISSKNYVKTVGVFSAFKPDQWDGKKIYMTGASLTSIYLLQLLCKKYLKVQPEFYYQDALGRNDEDPEQIMKEFDGVLFIGDRVIEARQTLKCNYYDLAQLWYQCTSQAFVFALWLVRDSVAVSRPDQVEHFLNRQLRSIEKGLANLDAIYEANYQNLKFGRDELKEYLSHSLGYFLGESELQGLARFNSDLAECGFLNTAAEIRFFEGTPRAMAVGS